MYNIVVSAVARFPCTHRGYNISENIFSGYSKMKIRYQFCVVCLSNCVVCLSHCLVSIDKTRKAIELISPISKTKQFVRNLIIDDRLFRRQMVLLNFIILDNENKTIAWILVDPEGGGSEFSHQNMISMLIEHLFLQRIKIKDLLFY